MRENWIKATGRIQVDTAVRIVTRVDFIKYYQWLIQKAFYGTLKFQTPKHQAHITIINPKISPRADIKRAKIFEGQQVTFFYNPESLYISRVNYWIPAKADIERQIKQHLRVTDYPCDKGLHLTVANVKFNNGQ